MFSFVSILLITVVAVAFFALAMFLPWLIKGHNRDAEIGTNPHMRARGIRCAARQACGEEASPRGKTPDCLPGEHCAPKACADCAEKE